ncbi:MAG: phenol hydroxylase [Gammaproteobacteria bacterium]|nr:MAG: phenol hydroxylase [Gammaproteobacteria bacterium]
MHIDIKAKKIEPIRQTYSHVARRIGENKPATRYQEAVYDLQPVEHFHYRPSWQPDKELYDASRTALKMEDWYKFLDPRQYYYGTYCMTRAKQQVSTEHNFKFVKQRKLLSKLSDTIHHQISQFIIPLRHFEWGANMNNTQICAMGYGAAITSTAMFNAGDRLGNAQYITQIGLALSEDDSEILDTAKSDWLDKDIWQGLRKIVEDSFVVEDWFELFVAQNLVMDGLIHPLFFNQFEEKINNEGGSSYSMLTEFIVTWDTETSRWVDKQIQVATAESEQNKNLVSGWFSAWLTEAEKAILPLAEAAFENGSEVFEEVKQALLKRATKVGINL